MGDAEPAEGQYDFEWLDQLMDTSAHENGIQAILATPSGAKPAWMSHAYPEIRRVDAQGRREPHFQRHNHCPTSPRLSPKKYSRSTHTSLNGTGHIRQCSWARFQRVQRRWMSLRPLLRRFPCMAAQPLWHAGCTEPCVVDDVLEPPLHRLVSNRTQTDRYRDDARLATFYQ